MKKNKKADLPETDTFRTTQKKYDFAVKFLCVFAAFILWLYVMEVESPAYETLISGVTVELTGTGELESENGLSVYSGRGVPVTITVSGKRSVVNKIHPDDIIATVDVSNITEAGRHSLPVKVDPINNVSIQQISQETIMVYVDQADMTVIPVKENLVGLDLPNTYEIGTIQFEYNSINITGPKNVLSNVAAARIDIDMANKTGSFTTEGEIYLVDRHNNRISNTYLSYSPVEMIVEVPIYKSVTVPVEVSFLHGYLNESNASIQVTPAQVTIQGDESVMNTENLLTPIILDEKKITGNSYGKTVTLQTADGTYIDGNVTEVQINVEIDPSIHTMDLLITDIQATGADGIRYVIEDSEMLVTLRGPIDKLGKIRRSDVSAIVDLSGYSTDSSGTVTKTAQIVIDAEEASEIYEVGEYTVQVKIN